MIALLATGGVLPAALARATDPLAAPVVVQVATQVSEVSEATKVAQVQPDKVKSPALSPVTAASRSMTARNLPAYVVSAEKSVGTPAVVKLVASANPADTAS